MAAGMPQEIPLPVLQGPMVAYLVLHLRRISGAEPGSGWNKEDFKGEAEEIPP